MGNGIVSAEQIKASLQASSIQARRVREETVRQERAKRQAALLEQVDPIVATLTRVRRVKGWSQETLEAEIKKKGDGRLSARSLNLYERGLRSPTLESLRLWAGALEVELDARLIDVAVRQLVR